MNGIAGGHNKKKQGTLCLNQILLIRVLLMSWHSFLPENVERRIPRPTMTRSLSTYAIANEHGSLTMRKKRRSALSHPCLLAAKKTREFMVTTSAGWPDVLRLWPLPLL
jgi:hypothetical protein